MRDHGYRRYLNPALVLLSIRDGEDLFEVQTSRGYSPIEVSILSKQYRVVLQSLEAVGFVDRRDTELFITETAKRFLEALNISLTELSQMGPDTVVLDPAFGRPEKHPNNDLFVLMPFTNEKRPVYDDHIVTVANKLTLSVGRADDFFSTNTIIDDIWSGIFSATVVIADSSGRNPNVFCEIGTAHAIGRPVILISDNLDDVPFDLRHRRFIEYSYTPRGAEI